VQIALGSASSLEQAPKSVEASLQTELVSLNLDCPLRQARDEFERRYLKAQLKLCKGSMTELARRTGMERTNLYRKLKALGINSSDKSNK